MYLFRLNICILKIAGNKSPLILAFSFYTHGKQLFSCEKSASTDAMDCMNGIRSLTAIWIVFGQTFSIYHPNPKIPIQNFKTVAEVNDNMIVWSHSPGIDNNYLNNWSYSNHFYSLQPIILAYWFTAGILRSKVFLRLLGFRFQSACWNVLIGIVKYFWFSVFKMSIRIILDINR